MTNGKIGTIQKRKRKIRLHWTDPALREVVRKTKAKEPLTDIDLRTAYKFPGLIRKFCLYLDDPYLAQYMDAVAQGKTRYRMPSDTVGTLTANVSVTVSYDQKKRWEPDPYYKTAEWKRLRYDAIKLHGAKCVACGRTPRDHGIVINVDHIKPIRLYPELRDKLNNLQPLCDDCNAGKGNRDQTDWRTGT